MKFKYIPLILAVFAFTPQVQAEGWLDSLKSMLGMGEEKPAAPNIGDMLSSVTESLGVTDSQAKGGLGSLFNYAKNNVSPEQFSSLTSALPGLGDLIKSAPDVSKLAEKGGLDGLLDKAADYNESLKALNDVKKQFEALGLKPEMIMQFVKQAQTYLDTEEGKKIKETLMQGLGNLKL